MAACKLGVKTGHYLLSKIAQGTHYWLIMLEKAELHKEYM